MWYKLPLLAGWLAIFVVLSTVLVAGLQIVRSRVAGWSGTILGELFILALLLMPFFNIWFLTGEFFSDAMLVITIGTRVTGLLASGIARLILGEEQQQRTEREVMLVRELEPAVRRFFQGMSAVLQVYSFLSICIFSVAYLLLDARAAADVMLSFCLWSNPVVMLVLNGFGNLVLLSVPFLNEKMRENTFVEAAIGLAPIFMAIILTLYILYPGSIFATTFTLLGHGVPLYVAIAAAAFLTFLAMVVAPYAVGVRKDKKQRAKLCRRKKSWAGWMSDCLLAANRKGDTEALRPALEKLKASQRQLEEQHGVIERSAILFDVLSDPEKEQQSQILRTDVERFRSEDPRVRLHSYLQQNIDDLQYALDAKEAKREVLAQRQVLDHFALENLRAQARAQDELTAVERSTPAFFGAIASTLGVIVSLALSLFGKMLFELIGRTVAVIL